MDTSVKENLKYLMKRDGKISEGELSRKTGIPQTTIHRILSGEIKESKPSTLRPLANYFGLTIAQLQGDEPLLTQRSISDACNTYTMHSTPARLLPLISWEEISWWHDLCKNYTPDTKNGWIATNKDVSPSAYGLIVQGNSMTSNHGPNFENGFEIIVDPNRPPKHRDFVIARHPEHPLPLLRQLSIEGGEYVLFPLNPRYPVLILNNLSEVYGVVCQLLATL